MKQTTERKTLTIPETAKVLGIGLNQAYEAAKRGDIPNIRVGKRILVPVAALEAKLAGREHE
jgi:excisionase family DNA binding protein